MSLILRPKGKHEEVPEISRIAVTKDVATAFRKLCRHAKRDANELLEEMMIQYVKTEKIDVVFVRTNSK